MKGAFKAETDFIRWLSRTSGRSVPGLRLGIGDDGALIRVQGGQELILTTDLSIEGVHFSQKYHPPEAVGHRALARSLSDVAAMGGRPRFALISLALSKQIRRAWVERFYWGLRRLADRFHVMIIGGDTAIKQGGLVVDVMVAGTVAQGAALVRSGAKGGDAIFVAGTLGLSALGLRLLRRPTLRSAAQSKAVRVHLYPEPQCRLGWFLARRRLASAAIDLSDGLSADLPRLLRASGVGARVRREAIPVVGRWAPSAIRTASPLSLALGGGEDYTLLFTVPRSKLSRVPAVFEGTLLTRIGEICREHRGVAMIEENGQWKALPEGGYDHFRRI